MIKVKQNVASVAIAYGLTSSQMTNSESLDFESICRIMAEMKVYKEQHADSQSNRGVIIHLKAHLSNEDFLFCQTVRWTLNRSVDERKVAGWYKGQSLDGFEQLCGRYKRAGYELIANIYQQEQKTVENI